MSETPETDAPGNSLPTWEECRLRVENSDYLKRNGIEHSDSPQANDLHRFIYEYDDADPYKSAWFMHRLELALSAHSRSLESRLRAAEKCIEDAAHEEACTHGRLPYSSAWDCNCFKSRYRKEG